jgi:phospholipase/lecithinase/hemolysin
MALALLLAALTACSTPAQSVRVISFGDSLSDLGTYADRTEGRTAGRFTTNPGPIWVEVVASQLGTSISGYRRAGWGHAERAAYCGARKGYDAMVGRATGPGSNGP